MEQSTIFVESATITIKGALAVIIGTGSIVVSYDGDKLFTTVYFAIKIRIVLIRFTKITFVLNPSVSVGYTFKLAVVNIKTILFIVQFFLRTMPQILLLFLLLIDPFGV